MFLKFRKPARFTQKLIALDCLKVQVWSCLGYSMFIVYLIIRLAAVWNIDMLKKKMIFSSPEPSGSQGELIVYPYSGVRFRRRRCRRSRRCRRRRQQCLNTFSSETALPIKAKFYVEPPWEGGTEVYINGPGHMTKMAVMPIYGKNL